MVVVVIYGIIRYLGREKNNNILKNEMTETKKKLNSPYAHHSRDNKRVERIYVTQKR